MQDIGVPWWLSGKESACHAGDMGSIPGQGTKIPRALGRLSPCTPTREAPVRLSGDPVQPKKYRVGYLFMPGIAGIRVR